MSRKILPANIALKRAYEPPSEADGVRILVDRLWPRGVTKKAAAIDRWAKEVAPSTELRKWYGHEPARWKEFGQRYRAELKGKQDELDAIREVAEAGPITLIYAAHDTAHSHAIVLRDALLNIRAGTKSRRG
ncbi:MAG: hypothetical protein BGP05_09165 [Rhizobiales bacterium 62-47]|nr:DUF488 domain-containing protein [Hyphomicrobiales bacterium]OJY14280.1 MAG: hypothetical protein BGP05_09165 [Rhizobiales bacterium 62-47]